MSDAKIDLEIDQGADFDYEIILADETGAPEDLLGWFFTAKGRVSYEDRFPLFILAQEPFAPWLEGVTYQPDQIIEANGKHFIALLPDTLDNPPEIVQRAERTRIVCRDNAAAFLNSTYFLIDHPTGGFYVWFNSDGTGVNPLVPSRSGVMVPVVTGDTATDVAAALQGVLDALPDFSAEQDGIAVVAENSQIGPVPDAADGGSPTTFSFVIEVQGVDMAPIPPDPGENPPEVWRRIPVGSIETEPTEGLVRLLMPAAETALLNQTICIYNLDAVNGSITSRVATGSARINREVNY